MRIVDEQTLSEAERGRVGMEQMNAKDVGGDVGGVRSGDVWAWGAIGALIVGAVAGLYWQGRLWICRCGRVLLWTGDVWSSDNSQHVSDPYSFTHIEHGLIFYVVLDLVFPRMRFVWKLCVALVVEAVWEVFENSAFVIQRYREVTAALGYEGDTIVNSVGDILFCALGVGIARYLGGWRAMVLLVVMEVVLVVWIRDSLLLNVIMLVYPLEAIRVWQRG